MFWSIWWHRSVMLFASTGHLIKWPISVCIYKYADCFEGSETVLQTLVPTTGYLTSCCLSMVSNHWFSPFWRLTKKLFPPRNCRSLGTRASFSVSLGGGSDPRSSPRWGSVRCSTSQVCPIRLSTVAAKGLACQLFVLLSSWTLYPTTCALFWWLQSLYFI